ncbi:MAG: hypothetical protein ABSE07_12900 [Methanoregula sp.]
MQRATSVISILNKYGIDTTTYQNTLSTISSQRSTLETALTAKDKDELKTVNAELKTLWQQFRRDMRDAIKATMASVHRQVSIVRHNHSHRHPISGIWNRDPMR